jgi:hypothetical protein
MSGGQRYDIIFVGTVAAIGPATTLAYIAGNDIAERAGDQARARAKR